MLTTSDSSDQAQLGAVDAELQPPPTPIRVGVRNTDSHKLGGGRTYDPSEVYASKQQRIAEYQQLRDAYSLCAGTTEAKLRIKRMRDKYASELEAAGVKLAEVGEYRWHETEYSPPAALRVTFSKKAILEDYA